MVFQSNLKGPLSRTRLVSVAARGFGCVVGSLAFGGSSGIIRLGGRDTENHSAGVASAGGERETARYEDMKIHSEEKPTQRHQFDFRLAVLHTYINILHTRTQLQKQSSSSCMINCKLNTHECRNISPMSGLFSTILTLFLGRSSTIC